MTGQVVIFDGDDTLWFVEHLYQRARSEAAAIVGTAGLDEAHWEKLQRRLDVEYVEFMGMSADRFPESCVEAYRRLTADRSAATSREYEPLIRQAARRVFEQTAAPAEHAIDILQALSRHFTLVLLTKGDDVIQQKRIADAGVAAYFDHISIVPNKTECDFANAVTAVNGTVGSSWSVGNSLPSDINPALRIGMKAIWIDAPVWEYEKRESSPVLAGIYRANDLQSAERILSDSVPKRVELHLSER